MSVSRLSSTLLNLMKAKMPPLISSEQIGLASPDEAKGKYLLGLHLFRIMRDSAFSVSNRVEIDTNTMQKPPLCLELMYMMTPFAASDSQALDNHRILERALKVCYDNPVLEPYSSLQPDIVPLTRIELISLDIDELSKVWQFGGMPHIVSLFYRLAPVPIGSDISTVVTRVSDTWFDVNKLERG